MHKTKTIQKLIIVFVLTNLKITHNL